MNTKTLLAPGHEFIATWRLIKDTVANSLRRPALAPEEVHLREAAAVRALADTYRQSDPGFASDLHAAADRHEVAHDPSAATAQR
jgi:hypothetical protein